MSADSDSPSETLVSSKLNINTVLVLLGLVFQAGIYFGAIQPLPGKMEEGFADTKSQISALSTKVSGLEFGQQQSTKDIGAVNGRLDSVEKANNDQWEVIRQNQVAAGRALQRDDFLEWKAEYSRRNPSTEIPPLPKSQN